MLCHQNSVSSVIPSFAASLWIAASCCSAVETTVIATGLDRPTAVAVVGEQVFYSDAGGLHSLGATPTSALDGAIHSLARLDEERLVVSVDEVEVWSPAGDPARLERSQSVRVLGEPNSQPFTSLTTDARHAFAIREGRIYRSRRAGHSLTSLRAFGTSWADDVTALALSERGYLVLLQADASGWRLVFCDPYAVEGEPLASWKVPLTEPLAIAYSPLPYPTERRLYTLTTDGLYRLDATVGDTIAVIKIGDIPHPTAMAFAADGTLYITALTDDGAGVLLRMEGAL